MLPACAMTCVLHRNDIDLIALNKTHAELMHLHPTLSRTLHL